MNIGTIGNMMVIVKNWTIMDFGFKLLKKKDKNEEERKAAQSFSVFFTLLCTIVGLTAIVIFIALTAFLLSLADTMGSKRYGTVKGDYIQYVQGDMNYLPISASGLEAYDLQEGDRIVIIFDSHTDKIVKLVPERQHNEELIRNVSIILCSLFGCVVLLVIFSVVGQGTFGRAFSLYYSLSLKRENAPWNMEARRKIYEERFTQAFGQKKAQWFQGGMAMLALLLLIGFVISVLLLVGKVYALVPDQGLVIGSRWFGGISLLVHIGFLVWYAKYDQYARPLYSAGEHLLNTQLLTRNVEGRLGYYTASGVWMELQDVKVKRQNETMVQIKCRYRLASNGKEISRLNYIAKEDMIYPLVAEMDKSGKKAGAAGYVWQIGIILLLYIILLISNGILLKERDRNTISFQTSIEEDAVRRG